MRRNRVDDTRQDTQAFVNFDCPNQKYRFHLTDPRDHTPYSIGMTNNVARRYHEHCTQPRKTLVSKRNQEIIHAGHKPGITRLQTVDTKIDAYLAGIHLIEHFKLLGVDLRNRENRQWLRKRLEDEGRREYLRTKRPRD